MPRVLNQTKGTVVAEEVRVARSFWSRFRGLMLRASLPRGRGILIWPSSSIHTAFMRFPIDVVFIDRDHRVVKVVEKMRPYRVAFSGGHAALELAAGAAAGARVQKGDQLVLDDEER